MSGVFQNIKDAINGLKNLGQVLEELRATRALIQQNVDLIQNYAETLRGIKKQLEDLIGRLPFK